MTLGRKAALLARITFLRSVLPDRVAREPLDLLLPSLTPAGRLAHSDPSLVGFAEASIESLLKRHWPLRTTCLYRSLVRYAILRDLGVPVRFVMGIRNDGTDLAGHAWLELDGRPHLEVLEHRYTRTFEYPLDARPSLEP
ncbi:MAG: lasso peptide biosynthesis B2 protein [Deltaproteobacteria bacterium]|nr:lasso peptide biosynthesis B2 protein [Deltaproteobacteria bacterium]